MNRNLLKKLIRYSACFLIAIYACPYTAFSAVYSERYIENVKDENQSLEIEKLSPENEAKEATLASPRLLPIPKPDEVNPHKADNVPASQELLDIIRKVKNQTIPHSKSEGTPRKENTISKRTLEIIKSEGKAVEAQDIAPSPALKAVLDAYRNGQLTYAQRSFNPDEIEEQYFYHQPYSDIDLESVFDMTVLTSGKDIFLSLGLTPLQLKKETEEETRSRKLKELQQIIAAFKASDARKAAALSPDEKELERLKVSAQSQIQPRKLMVKQLMDFFGIRRRGDESQSYEEMASAFRLYKQWVNRWERMDMYVKKKRVQKIQLNRYQRIGGSTGQPSSYGKQIQVNPYGYDRIYSAPK